jgi:hypothetical protein
VIGDVTGLGGKPDRGEVLETEIESCGVGVEALDGWLKELLDSGVTVGVETGLG